MMSKDRNVGTKGEKDLRGNERKEKTRRTRRRRWGGTENKTHSNRKRGGKASGFKCLRSGCREGRDTRDRADGRRPAEQSGLSPPL